MTVDLRFSVINVIQVNDGGFTFEQLSHWKIVPRFFTLTPFATFFDDPLTEMASSSKSSTSTSPSPRSWMNEILGTEDAMPPMSVKGVLSSNDVDSVCPCP